MERISAILRFLVAATVLICFGPMCSAEVKTLRVGVYNFEPVISIAKDGSAQGIYIDVLNHIAAKEGWKLDYVNGSWAECLDRLQRGEIDIQPSIGYTEARAKTLDFTNDYLVLDWGMIYRGKSRRIESLIDLKGKRVGALQGSVYTEGLRSLLDQFGIQVELVPFKEYKEVLQAVDNQTVDAGVITRIYGTRLESDFSNIESTNIVFSPLKLLFAVPKGKHADIRAVLNREFAEMKADSKSVFHESYKRWMGFYEKRGVLPVWVAWGALGGVGLLLLLFVANRVLRKQVAARTAELKQSNEALQESETRFRTLFDHAPDAIILLDMESRQLVDANQNAETLFECSRAELLGKSLRSFYKPVQPDGLSAEDSIALTLERVSNGESVFVERHIRTKSGKEVYAEARVDRITIGGLPMVRGSFLDITDRKNSETQLKAYSEELQTLNESLESRVLERTEELKTANQALSESAASLSHSNFLIDQAMDLARSGHWSIDFSAGDEYYVSSPRVVEIFGDPPRADMRFHIMEDWYVNLVAADETLAKATLANYLDALAGHVPRYDCIHPYCRPVDGKIIWVHVLGAVIRDGRGKPSHVYGVVMDITELKTAEIALHQAKEAIELTNRSLEEKSRELARSNKDLEQFAYVASHDLQEPLRMIVGFVQLLEKRLRDKLDDESREFMGYVIDGSARMQRLIQDVLAYSRVGSRSAPPESVSCTDVVKDAMAALGNKITETGAQVDVGSLPVVKADRTQLTQLFQNLIGNAIKFCKNTAPKVRIDVCESGAYCRFSVTDNGIGIAEEYRERIFGVFQRLHTRDDYEGTGIGLAICKRIVQRHGGEIGVTAASGGGSTFWFTFPVESIDDTK